MFNVKKVSASVMMVLMMIMAINICLADIVINEFEVTTGEDSINVTVSAKDETNGMAEHPYRVTMTKGEEEIHNSGWIGENREEFQIDETITISENSVLQSGPDSSNQFVRMNNGWLIFGSPYRKYDPNTQTATYGSRFYRSVDQGKTWDILCFFTTGNVNTNKILMVII